MTRRGESNEHAILERLTRGPATATELQVGLELSVGGMRRALARLHQRGQVRSDRVERHYGFPVVVWRLT